MMTLQEAIEKIKQHREMICSELPEGPLFTALQAVADGTMIPADACFNVDDGVLYQAMNDGYGRYEEFKRDVLMALEIRSADDVRREAVQKCITELSEGYLNGDGLPAMVKRMSALIDTPQPKPDLKCLDCKGTGQRDSGGVYPWGEGIFVSCDCDTQPKGGDDE